MSASIRTATLIALASASLLVYLAGCGDSGDPGTGGEAAKEPITLRSSGGYPGSTSSVEINPDGTVHIVSESFDGKSKNQRFAGPADELTEIRAELDDLELGSLDLPTSPDCCDLVYYELSYGDETVKTDTSTAPEELGDVIGDINELQPPAAAGTTAPDPGSA